MSLKNAVFAVLLCTACALASAAPEGATRLRLLTENSAPASMHDGNQIVGSGTEKVREIMARTGIRYTLELLPWRRAYTLATERPDTCLFSTTRTPEREQQFKWVGPTDEADWVLLGRTDRDYHLNSLEDARGLRIGTYNGDAREAYLRARGFQVDSASSDIVNPRKLLLDRIDLWAASFRRGDTFLARNGWSKKIVPVFTFNRVGLYLACNPAVPQALVDRMNGALEAMVRDGTVKRIDRKYDKWTEPAAPGK